MAEKCIAAYKVSLIKKHQSMSQISDSTDFQQNWISTPLVVGSLCLAHWLHKRVAPFDRKLARLHSQPSYAPNFSNSSIFRDAAQVGEKRDTPFD